MQALLLIVLAALIQGTVLAPPPPPPPPPVRVGGEVPQTGEGLLQGFVRRFDNGEALTDIRVSLIGPPIDSTGAVGQRQTTTDVTGWFAFRNLPAGTYTVTASREGYFGLPVNGIAPTSVKSIGRIDAQQKTLQVGFGLIPGGTIRGTIRDANGDPAVNIPVTVWRLTYREGSRTLATASTVRSTEDGTFRLGSLPPGEFYVRAGGGPLGARGGGNGAMAFYPGVLDAELATPIRIRGGDETAVDVRLIAQKPVRISGTVINTIPELALDPLLFLLIPKDLNRIDDGSGASAIPNTGVGKPNGYFEIVAPRPGNYELMPIASVRRSPPTPATTTVPERLRYFTGRTTIQVRDQDVDGVTVAVTRGVDLSVRVSRGSVSAASLQGLRLGLRSVEMISTAVIPHLEGHSVPDDGNLLIVSVPEGSYALTTQGAPAGVYIADVRQGGSIYDHGPIRVGKDFAEPVEVVLAAGGGRVEGTVERVEGVSGSILVSLIPEGVRRDNLLLYRRAPLTEGRFVMMDVPPGSYKLYAWEDLPTGADENARFMSSYEYRGRAVTVRAGGTANVALTLIRR